MKRRVLSLFMAAMSMAMFGILYPEYILLPDTYEYIAEEDLEKEKNMYAEEYGRELGVLLHASPDEFCISSKFLQYMAEEGKDVWKKMIYNN